MIGLTKAMKDMLGALNVLTVDGCSPTFEEIMAHTGLKSKSNVHRLLTSLEERGYIRRLYGRARAIEVLHSTGQSFAEKLSRLDDGAFAQVALAVSAESNRRAMSKPMGIAA